MFCCNKSLVAIFHCNKFLVAIFHCNKSLVAIFYCNKSFVSCIALFRLIKSLSAMFYCYNSDACCTGKGVSDSDGGSLESVACGGGRVRPCGDVGLRASLVSAPRLPQNSSSTLLVS